MHCIVLALCPIIHRINAPFLTSTMVRGFVNNPVQDWITHVHVPMCHIDLRAQDARSIWKLANFHPLQQNKVFFNRTIPAGTLNAWLGPRTSIPSDLFRALIVHVRFAFFDQFDRPFIKQTEEIRRK